MYMFVFKLRTEAFTLGLLTDSFVRIMLLKNFPKVEKSYSGQTLTRFQTESHLVNAP